MLHDPVGMVRGVRSEGHVIGSRRRILLIAALAIPIAGAVALGARGESGRAGAVEADRRDRRIAADSLPWSSIVRETVGMNRIEAPAALLYVLPSCSHCDAAAVAFAKETQRRRLRALIVAGSGSAEAQEYRVRHALPPIATDSAREFARAAGIRLVPSLVTVANGSVIVEPVPSPRSLRRMLQRVR